MSVTPNDLELPDGPVACTHCGNSLTANQRAITFHHHCENSVRTSTILCETCVPVVLGSLIQDWAEIIGDTWFDHHMERRDRLVTALTKLKDLMP